MEKPFVMNTPSPDQWLYVVIRIKAACDLGYRAPDPLK